jgi:hypothetical protein
VITELGMPTSAAIQGDYVSVPDLQGRLVILDKSNTIMAVLGHNPDPRMGANYKVPQKRWREGISPVRTARAGMPQATSTCRTGTCRAGS